MKESTKNQIRRIASLARQASFDMALLPKEIKNKALTLMAQALKKNARFIIRQNLKDLKEAKNQRLSQAFIDRLTLTEERINKMAKSLEQLRVLKDPVGETIKRWKSPINGLIINKVRIPIGVIAIIYESRPDVTSDCIGLCVKSGNCVILRGGAEALNSNQAIYRIITRAVAKFLPKGSINIVPVKERAAISFLLKLNDDIDLVIPRGGEGLIKKVASISRIPVIKHYKGICHVYVDKDANLDMAGDICFNAKVQRPGACNAMESMLVHKDIAARFLPAMSRRFRQAGVQIRGCRNTAKIIKGIRLATEKDYRTEYLDLILSVKVVASLDEAITHINEYGTHHSDSIVTENNTSARKFLAKIDSACVYQNASTRFTDGYQFGLGAEIGISTEKIHARGPMALEELTTYKYIVYGRGQIRTS